jgi:hypothetical protein
MIVPTKPLNEITTQAMHLLCKEMGTVNTIRFINQFTVGYFDNTKEREQLFADMTVADIVSEIKKSKNE